MSSTVPVNTAAELPAAKHGVPGLMHEHPKSRGIGRVINTMPSRIRIRTFSQKPEVIAEDWLGLKKAAGAFAAPRAGYGRG